MKNKELEMVFGAYFSELSREEQIDILEDLTGIAKAVLMIAGN